MERWLTDKEASLELKISMERVRRLIASGHLAAIVVGPRGRNGIEYRILDPAPALRKKLNTDPIDEFHCITNNELGEILGLNPSTLRSMNRVEMGEKRVRGAKRTNSKHSMTLYSPMDVRRIIAVREKRTGHKKYAYSSTIVNWMRRYIQELKPNGQVLDELIKEAVKLPEPERSKKVHELWLLFDRVNAILKECLLK